jgi:hypothetical protein
VNLVLIPVLQRIKISFGMGRSDERQNGNEMKPKMPLKTLGPGEHNYTSEWTVEFHEEFFSEFQDWSEQVQDGLLIQTGKLKVFGPSLGTTHCGYVEGIRIRQYEGTAI